MSNLVIDIGTSAASFGVELAARYPERQIVVVNEDLTDSELALPTKALLLRELEELPTRLQKKHGEHIYLLFPTKQNLENIISIDDKTWNALYRLCIPGALIGGFVMGISETFVSGYLSTTYRDAIAFVLLILILHCKIILKCF